MPIRVECPCGWTDQVKSAFAGQEIRCGDCGKRLTVPFEDADVVEVIEDVGVEVIDDVEEIDEVELIDEPKGFGKRRKAAASDVVEVIDDDDDDEDAPRRGGRAPAGKGGSSSTLLVVVVLLLLVGGGGGAAAWWFLQPPGPNPDEFVNVPPGPGPGPVPVPPIPMPPLPMPPTPEPEPQGPWKGHLSPILAVGVAPDGREVFTAGGGVSRDGKPALAQDNTLRSFDATTGERKLRQDIPGGVAVAAFSPDGKWAAVVPLGRDANGTFQPGEKDVVLWDLAAGKEAARLTGPTEPAACLAFTPDSKRLLAGGPDKTLRLWNLPNKSHVATLGGHDGAVLSVAVSKDGKRAVSGGADKAVRLWDLDAKTALRVVGQHEDVRAVAFLPSGKEVVSAGGGDHDLRLWDADMPKELGRFKGHADRVVALAVSPDGRKLLSAGADRTARLWSVESRKSTHTFSGHNAPVAGVAFLGGDRAVSVGEDKEVRVWPLPVSVDDLLAQLKGGAKAEAIAGLAKLGAEAKSAVPELLVVYKADAPLRDEVVKALKQVGPVDAEGLKLLLTEAHPAGREFALAQLGKAPPAEATPLLDLVLACLRDPKGTPNGRKEALAVLANIGPDASKDALGDVIAQLGDLTPAVVAEANRALEKFGPATEAQLPTLKKALEGTSSDAKKYALTAIGGLRKKGAPATAAVTEILERSGDPDLKRQALAVLLQITEPDSDATRAILVRVLPDAEVANAALDALAAQALTTKLVALFVEALDSESPAVRQKVQTILSQKTLTPEHVKAFVPILEGKKREQQKIVLALLKGMKPEAAAPAAPGLYKILEQPDAEAKALRRPTLDVLKHLGGAARVEGAGKILATIANEDAAFRFEVTEILADLVMTEADELMPRVVRQLVAPEAPGAKDQAIAVLNRLGPRSVKYLVLALDGPFLGNGQAQKDARLEAIRLLHAIGSKEKVPLASSIKTAMAKIEGNPSESAEIKQAAKEARLAVK